MPSRGLFGGLNEVSGNASNTGADYFLHIPSVIADRTVAEALSADTTPSHLPLRGWAPGFHVTLLAPSQAEINTPFPVHAGRGCEVFGSLLRHLVFKICSLSGWEAGEGLLPAWSGSCRKPAQQEADPGAVRGSRGPHLPRGPGRLQRPDKGASQRGATVCLGGQEEKGVRLEKL